MRNIITRLIQIALVVASVSLATGCSCYTYDVHHDNGNHYGQYKNSGKGYGHYKHEGKQNGHRD